MKKLFELAALLSAGTLLLGGFTFAAVGNDHTCFESDNDASIETDNHLSVEAVNHLLLDNGVDGTIGSGYNDVNYNTGNEHAYR